MDPNIAKWFKPGDAVKYGFTLDDLVRDMDAAEVEKGVITAAALRLSPSPYSVGQNISDETYEKLCTRVAEMRKKDPGRFHACLGIDPTGMMRTVRWLERAVKEFGFRSCWIMPSLVACRPIMPVIFRSMRSASSSEFRSRSTSASRGRSVRRCRNNRWRSMKCCSRFPS